MEFSNLENRITGATLQTPYGMQDVPANVIDTAMFGLLGKFKGEEGALGSTYFQFDRAME